MDLTQAVAPRVVPPHKTDITCASHLRAGLDPEERVKTLRRICMLLRYVERNGACRGDAPLQFDAIAARGISGLLFAPIVAMKLNKTMLIVRKGEQCHSSRTVEGDYGARRYIILDDLIASGDTVKTTVRLIAEDVPHAICVGMLKYNSLTEPDTWEDCNVERRISHHFYTTDALAAYCEEIDGQEQRAVDATARYQSTTLGEVARVEASARWRASNKFPCTATPLATMMPALLPPVWGY